MVENWTIWARKKNGHVMRCFTWSGPAQDGIARARAEAKDFDYDLEQVWAEKQLSVLEAIIANGRVVVVRG